MLAANREGESKVLARLIATIALLLAVIQPVWAADISDVRIGVHPGKTRLVVEVSDKVPYRVFTLSEH